MKEIDRHHVEKLLADGAQLAEVLPSHEYDEGHLPGAVHLPLRTLESLAPTALDRSRPVIVYCWDSA